MEKENVQHMISLLAYDTLQKRIRGVVDEKIRGPDFVSGMKEGLFGKVMYGLKPDE